jgi:uncharacterized protein YcaQ
MKYKLIYFDRKYTILDERWEAQKCFVECYYPDASNTPGSTPPLLRLRTQDCEDAIDDQWRLMIPGSEASVIREAIAQFDQYYKLQGGVL